MSTLFLKNPRLTILTIGLICVAGLSSYVILPRMEDPLLAERAAFILTTFPGADAVQVESLVTEPIEDELRDIAEIKEIRSSSRNSASTITIELRDDVYADEAPTIWSRIRDRVADAEANLPENASKPLFERIEVTAYTRLIALVWDESSDPQSSISSGEIPTPDAVLRRQAEDLREALLAVPGTKDVDIFGDPDEEIVVEIDSTQLAATGLSAAEVSQLIRESDARVSAGQLRGERSDLLIEVADELDSLQRVSSVPLKVGPDGRVILLSDVADVRRAVALPPSELAMVRDRPAIILGCLIRPDQRIDHWHQASARVTDDFRANLSRGIGLIDVFSQDGYVTERLTQLRNNLVLGALSVMIVILLLMGWRSALIVGVALPLSAFMVFTGMRVMETPVHQMSITGLIIALGLLIDNAIVVVDEVNQKLKDGFNATEAVRKTVTHLAVPLFGSTFTTALAFAPIALMPGPSGEFVGSIATNVIIAIFSSLLLAMTVVPALTGFLNRATRDITTDMPTSWWRDGWKSSRLLALYQRLLRVTIRAPWVGIAMGVVLPVAGFIQARLLPEQFFPPADRDQITVELELPSQASMKQTVDVTQRVRRTLLKQPGVKDVTWWIGRSAPPFYYNQIPGRRSQPQYAMALLTLESADDLKNRVNAMQSLLNTDFANARIVVRQLEQGPPFDAPIEVQILGSNLDVLRQLSTDVRQVLSSLPEVTHARAAIAEPLPRLAINIDEAEARLVGLSNQNVATQLFTSLEGAVGGMILEETEELPVRVRVADEDRSTTEKIESMNLVTTKAQASSEFRGVPLTALGKLELVPEQVDITRVDRRRLSEVQAFLKAGVLPAPVQNRLQAELNRRVAAGEIQIPPGYSIEFSGESAQRNDAIGNLMANVGVLAVLMVAALVMSFRSFRLATLIGLVAFLAVGLGVGALWVFGFPFGFMAIIGTMGLIGVAINDSIVVVAAIRDDPAARNGEPDAVLDVVVRATRHIVATSLTTMAGFMPLILAGGSFWPPLAVTIAGGVGGATIIALIFVPSCYLIIMRRSFECSIRSSQPSHLIPEGAK